jgi:hypothetical protein
MKGAIGSNNLEMVGAVRGSLHIEHRLYDVTLAERWLRAGDADRESLVAAEVARLRIVDPPAVLRRRRYIKKGRRPALLLIKAPCEQCGTVYRRIKSGQRFCKKGCATSWRHEARRGSIGVSSESGGAVCRGST